MDINQLILSVVLPVFLGVMSNLLTPRVQYLIAQRSIKVRNKTLKQLQAELELVISCHNSQQRLILMLSVYFAVFLLSIAFLVLSCFLALVGLIRPSSANPSVLSSILWLFTPLIMICWVIVAQNQLYNFVRKLLRYDEFLTSVRERIAKLEKLDNKAE